MTHKGWHVVKLQHNQSLSSRWLWTFNHNRCENCLEEVQGAATSSLFTPPLFQDTWPCVQLLCAERNAPCQLDLAIDKTKPPTSAVEWQGNDRTDLQCQAARCCHNQILKERRLCWNGHVECSNGAVKTAFHIQVEGKRGPGRPKMTWKQLTEEMQRVEALGYQTSW